MSTGISISSINRIKELAEEKKFKEALEILDTQNLDKSINPQFLKISGEIFRENKRYYDSRRILLKAHQMSPQGNRIIYELIQLYLELGYFSKAQKYYEQYLFYTTPDDTQKDYVEYIMKKAEGADVKDLATILIPILERMPEDKWNFEAILLYHKMDRKDMALDESRYILENFKESEYVQPVIDYIDDKLDVDQWFYVYPREEQPEDTELYGDLIELEEKILEADYRSMYPPEARIMVEAEDKDAPEVAPPKEKKPKKLFGKKAKKDAVEEQVVDGEQSESVEMSDKHSEQSTNVDASNGSEHTKNTDAASGERQDSNDTVQSVVALQQDTESSTEKDSKEKQTEDNTVENQKSEDVAEKDSVTEGSTAAKEDTDTTVSTTENVETQPLSAEEQVQKEREEALEKILSKKIDTEKIKESAKQVARSVKEIDTSKAKQQVKSAAETVKDNVKKASDVFGVAMGAKAATTVQDENVDTAEDEDIILDAIIESVLEPPKKAVGQVVMNEELDALIPDSLEAMSEEEIADIEAKKEELERLELEALEATLKLEEEKKAKKLQKKKTNDSQEDDSEDSEKSDVISEEDSTLDAERDAAESGEQSDATVQKEDLTSEDEQHDGMNEQDEDTQSYVASSDGSLYTELKTRFIEETEDEKPLDSLGFITVVHSDVDATMEDEIPDAAGMLRQMIDNKEFYSGEDSLGFESKASYENHGFEVEDYDFDTYRQQQEDAIEQSDEVVADIEESADVEVEEQSPVQDIFTDENVVAFEEVASEESVIQEELPTEEVVEEQATEEPIVYEEDVEEVVTEEPVVYEEVVEDTTEQPIAYEDIRVEEPVIYEDVVIEEPIVQHELPEEDTIEEAVAEEPIIYEEVVEEPAVYEDVVEAATEQPNAYEDVVGEQATEEPIAYGDIRVEEPVIYEDVVIEEPVIYEDVVIEEPIVQHELPEEDTIEEAVAEEPIIYEEVVEEQATEEPIVYKDVVEEQAIEEPIVYKDVVGEQATEQPITYEDIRVEEPVIYEDVVIEEPIAQHELPEEDTIEEAVAEEPIIYEEVVEEQVTEKPIAYEDVMVEEPVILVEDITTETLDDRRYNLRADIVLSYRMENLLIKLKESR